MKTMLFSLCILVLVGGCGTDGSGLLEPMDLLPSDGEISGWLWDGAPSEAADEASLYELINGGAVEFVERGFVSGALQRYGGDLAGSSTSIELFIADQGAISNAKSIYDKRAEYLLFAEDIAIGDAGDARIDDGSTLESIILDYWQERFYVQVTINNRQAAPDLARQTVVQFGENVSMAIAGR